MSAQSINSSFYSPYYNPKTVTTEEKRIMARILKYGGKPTGVLAHDKAILKEFELKEAKNRNSISSDFLVVKREDLIEWRKQNEKPTEEIDKDVQNQQREMAGATLLGEQLFLAITMNQREKTKEHRKVANSSEVDN